LAPFPLYGDLEEDALLDAKPVEADENISNVFGSLNAENKPLLTD